jgi:hypothetical protein
MVKLEIIGIKQAFWKKYFGGGKVSFELIIDD